MFVHLKRDLRVDALDWINSGDPWERPTESPLLPYGILREIQRRLSAVRTDLDSFSDAEAYALMCSGYLMTESALKEKGILGFDVGPANPQDWKFLTLKELMKAQGKDNPLLRQLKFSDKRFGKVWYLVPWLRALGLAAGAILLSLLVFLLVEFAVHPLPFQTWGELIGFTVLAVIGLFALEGVSRRFNYKKTLDQIFVGLGLLIAGSFLAKVHLYCFDKIFLWQGSIDRLLKPRR
jgi:hypothetical protein